MIYTLTLNPAVDYVVQVESLKPGRIMRSGSESVFFGGKGINVSLILKELEVESIAMGFLAGFTGRAIEAGLKEMGINCDFVNLKEGFTRINVKINSEEETAINGSGPKIDTDALSEFMDKLSSIGEGDTLVLAGSVPKSLPSNIYEMIMESMGNRGVKFVVDAAGTLLLSALKFRPFLIKPNADELSEIFSTEVDSPEKAEEYARELKKMGAKNVLVSMGGQGALLLDEDGKSHFMPAAKGTAVNTVGAGDSMVAGFLAGYQSTGDYDYALRLGTAAGGATAFSEGLAVKESILELMK